MEGGTWWAASTASFAQVLAKARTCMTDIGDLLLEKSPALVTMQKKVTICQKLFEEAKKLRVMSS